MVGKMPPPGLCSFSPERRCSVDVKTIRELRISATKHDQRGWMSENYPSLQRKEKCFLLTSPFIEPVVCSEHRRNTEYYRQLYPERGRDVGGDHQRLRPPLRRERQLRHDQRQRVGFARWHARYPAQAGLQSAGGFDV